MNEEKHSAAQAREADRMWSFRGHELKAGEFTTAMVHLFRAEINRANVWRARLDATTNWAVITTGAAISLAYTEAVTAHVVLILNMFLITIFLYIEARRYRVYELWSSRVRLMETDFFAGMLVPPFKPAPDWAESVAESLLQPQLPISIFEAFGRRLRRNYIWIYVILAAAWLLNIVLFPEAATSWRLVFDRASIGPIDGLLIGGLLLAFLGLMLGIALLTVRLQQASGEVLPRFGDEALVFGRRDERDVGGRRAWFRHSRRRKRFLATIITDLESPIADRILQDMQRGVTALEGKGMYTDKPHHVLLCAISATEVAQLRALVESVDPNAFMIVSAAHEVLGKGFEPFVDK